MHYFLCDKDYFIHAYTNYYWLQIIELISIIFKVLLPFLGWVILNDFQRWTANFRGKTCFYTLQLIINRSNKLYTFKEKAQHYEKYIMYNTQSHTHM